MYFATKAIFSAKNIDVKTHRALLAKFGLEFVNEGLIDEYYGKALRMAKEMREEAKKRPKALLQIRSDFDKCQLLHRR